MVPSSKVTFFHEAAQQSDSEQQVPVLDEFFFHCRVVMPGTDVHGLLTFSLVSVKVGDGRPRHTFDHNERGCERG
jgi:hypothetical protein